MKEYSEDYFFYFYALTKSKYFKEQWLGKGGIQKNTVSSDRAKTYLPKISNQKVVRFISILTQAILKKEQSIKERYINILSLIEQELLNNQKSNTFKFELPTINEIENTGRLDTNLYREHFKQIVFQIQNYTKGFQTIHELGFSLSRGQNLQVSNIGDSVYSKKKYKNFYTLMLPKFLSKYGTVDKVEYLGNPNSLKTLKKGDLIFGAEGFEKGRSIVIIEEQDRVITNIHGITIQQEEHNVNKAIFVKCCLDYLRSKGLIDLYAVGGNGGSLAQKYWDIIPFPNFPEPKQKEIALLYHNPESIYQTETFTLDNFLEQDNAFNETAGIYELDKRAKQLKEILNKAIDDIANDKAVEICFK
jgi:type I restriction enzyme S subunit